MIRTTLRPLCFALALVLAGPAQAVRLKIATVAPDGTTWMQQMRAGAEKIATATDGRVEIKFYPGGVMGNEKTVLRKMRVGQLHGGAFTSGSLAALYRDAEIYSLPFLFRSYAEVDYVRSALDERIRKGLAESGLVALAINETGFAYFMSEDAIRTVDDLKRRKVWALEGDLMSRTALDLADVSPVTLPISDVYTGLQTGLVDTIAAPPMAAIAFQWHTKVKYFTDVPLMYLLGILAVDAGAFERLTPADRETVRKIVGEISDRLDRESRESNREAREALAAQGIEFVEAPSGEEVQRWREIADRAIETLQTDQTYSPELLDAVQRRLREYRAGLEDGSPTADAR